MPRKGLEPSRPLSHWHLKPARLPIPPPGQRAGDIVGAGPPLSTIGHLLQAEILAVSRRIAQSARPTTASRRLSWPSRPIPTPWSRFSAAPGFSAATWSGRWPSGDYRIRVAVRRPELAGYLQPLGTGRPDPCGAGQSALPGLGRGRGARRSVAINLVGILFESGAPDLRRRAGPGRRAGRAGRGRRRRAHGACLGDRRRRAIRPRASPRQGRAARQAVLAAVPPGHRSCGRRWCSARRTSSSTGSPRWRAMSPALPLVGGGADQAAAGLCRRCRGSDGRAGRTACAKRGTDLRTRRAGSADHARDDGICACRSPNARALLVPLPFGLAKLQALCPAIRARHPAADAGPGRNAARRQCGVGGERRPPA